MGAGRGESSGPHGTPTVAALKPMPVEFQPERKTLSDLIEARVVDATLGTPLPEAIRTNPDIARLSRTMSNWSGVLQAHGHHPIMHLVAIKKDIYERYPSVPPASTTRSSSQRSRWKHMFNLRALRYMTPFLMRDIDEIYEIFNGDPRPYGVEKNRKTLRRCHLSRRSAPDRRARESGDAFVPTYG